MDDLPPPSVPPNGNHKIWSILCHLTCLIGIVGIGIILPLVVYLSMRHESEYVACNARAALNFHLSILLYTLCSIPLVIIVIGIPVLAILWLASLVLAIIAAIKASDGGCYHYPLCIRFVG